jgi:hypothetical protein
LLEESVTVPSPETIGEAAREANVVVSIAQSARWPLYNTQLLSLPLADIQLATRKARSVFSTAGPLDELAVSSRPFRCAT